MQPSRFKSAGRLRFSSPPYKAWVDTDPEISSFYRSLIPVKVNKPKYNPHISIVRNKIPSNISAWTANEGSLITFEYESYIYNDETYYWLNVFSEEIDLICDQLGVRNKSSIYNESIYHITIANIKNIG